MIDYRNLTTAQLERIIAIKQQIEDLQSQLDSIAGGGGRGPGRPKGKRRMSAAGRRAIAAGAKARWAKIKDVTHTAKPTKRKKWSAAARARSSAAAKARWKKAKAAGRTTL